MGNATSSTSGGKMSANAELLTAPTNEITRSNRGIKTAVTPERERERRREIRCLHVQKKTQVVFACKKLSSIKMAGGCHGVARLFLLAVMASLCSCKGVL